jgi:hypothetical protein
MNTYYPKAKVKIDGKDEFEMGIASFEKVDFHGPFGTKKVTIVGYALERSPIKQTEPMLEVTLTETERLFICALLGHSTIKEAVSILKKIKLGYVNPDVRVRYNHDKHGRKDTLYTVKLGDNVFFGIAKLNAKADKFNKEEGIKLAKKRCEEALDRSFTLILDFSTKQLMGLTHVSRVKDLLRYFDGLSQ